MSNNVFLTLCMSLLLLISICACDTRDSNLDIEATELEPKAQDDAEPTPVQKVVDPSYATYTNYMLSAYDHQTAIISPESIKSAFYMYSTLVSDDDRKEIQSFIGDKDFLSYQSTDALKIVNRIWYNTNMNFDFSEASDAKIANIIYGIDMSDPGATAVKDEFVNDNTNGLISKTPTKYTSETVIDAMNIIYFKDSWLKEKELLSYPLSFTNYEGEVEDLTAFSNKGWGVMESDTATACTMTYDHGYKFTVVLPTEGHTVDDIRIDEFIKRVIPEHEVAYYLEIPEFETESNYSFNLDTFNLKNSKMLPEIYDDSDYTTHVQHTVKIKFDHEGTEAAAVTSMFAVASAAAMEPEEIVELICDKPFIYYITDTTNNDIAFIGLYNG